MAVDSPDPVEPALGGEHSTGSSTDSTGSAEPSPWQRATEWKAQGLGHEAIRKQLKEHGVSDEDAAMLAHAVDGAAPPSLPEFVVSTGTNPLAPGHFSLFELGIQGPPHLVGLYWLTFGGVVFGVMALFNAMWAADIVEDPSDLAVVMSRLAALLALGAAVFGAYRFLSAIRVRRKSP